ncbi:MAG: DNA replication/repair protein RecF [Microbacteriaceae bacterium]|nr:DNA replication/repair protein RecF [Microbacteriaceae bacterium]NDE68469.1 DNA replication/repair protein RecF [Microbacteriaceae bacterium]
MHIKHLSLSNFRNYSTLELPLQPGVNLLVGRNGQGKTNLVEAIFYAATLNSHRVSGYLPLVKHQQDKAVMRILAGFEDRENLIELELNVSGANRARINRSDTPRVRDVLGLVSAVIFSPEDLDIVKRDPSNRRAFIDDLLVQLTPRLAGVFSDYDRVLKQRNTLLKTSRNLPKDSPGLDTLAAWDDSLIKLGTEIIAFRQDLIKRIAAPLLSSYEAIADEKNNPSIKYKSSLTGSNIVEPEVFEEDFLVTSDREEIETQFRTKLELVKSKELERGISLVGPHRDDLVLYLGDYPAKGFVSHGESWSYALALKLASAQLLREEARAGDPILILDDVFAELDSTRRTRLANLVSDNEQVLITAAVVEDVPTELSANRIFVTAGEIVVGNA